MIDSVLKAGRGRGGFTIVELIVIVVVIGILVGVTVVSYTLITKGVNEQQAANSLQKFATAANTFKSESGMYPSVMDQLDFTPAEGVSLQYSYMSSNDSFCATATYKGADAYIKSGSREVTSGGCPGHGVGGNEAIVNYSTNPGLEADVDGWRSNDGSVIPRSRDSSVARSGSWSIRQSPNSTSTALVSLYAVGGNNPSGFVLPGAGVYTQSIYFRADVPHTGRLAVAWRIGGVWQTAVLGSTINGAAGQWTRATQTFTLPANVEYVRPAMYVHSTTAQPGGTYGWVDDYMIVSGGTAPAFADGSTAGWTWNGMQNASSSTGPAL